MLLAAQSRGYQLLYLEQGDLWLRDGVACGRARPLEVFADPARWFQLGEPRIERLGGAAEAPAAQPQHFSLQCLDVHVLLAEPLLELSDPTLQ